MLAVILLDEIASSTFYIIWVLLAVWQVKFTSSRHASWLLEVMVAILPPSAEAGRKHSGSGFQRSQEVFPSHSTRHLTKQSSRDSTDDSMNSNSSEGSS